MKPRLFKTKAGLDAFAAANRGRAFHVLVLHDDGCSASRCVCRPWYEVRDLTAENLQDGDQRQVRWVKETAS